MCMRLYISIPTRNRNPDEIRKECEKAYRKVCRLLRAKPDKVLRDPLIDENDYIPITHPVMLLSKSLGRMSSADVAYFAEGWRFDPKCIIEHDVAVACGIQIIDGLRKGID